MGTTTRTGLAALGLALAACGAPTPAPTPAPVPSASAAPPASACAEDEVYAPRAAPTDKPALPAVPTLPVLPTRIGADYTVFGATHALASRVGSPEIARDEIAVVGYVVASNLATAPACALHKTGRKDPDGCVAELPAFVIADTKDARAERTIRVLGWASNWANVFEANQLYKDAKAAPATLYKDALWAVDVPYPLPAIGAKVRVRGRYGKTFTKSSSGIVSDPVDGILTYATMDVIEPAPEKAKLGGGR